MENKNWKSNIILLLVSQTISIFGSSLVQYALIWFITLNTNSGTIMSIFIICGFLPTLILSPFAGVWADKYDRKKLMIFADAFIALATLVMAVVFFMGYDSLYLLFFMSSLRALGSGVHSPAINAFIPQIVPEDMLTKVNAANSTIWSLVTLVSPMLSAFLLNLVSIELILLIDVVTAAIGISVLSFFVHGPSTIKKSNKQDNDYLKDLKEGIAYIKDHSYIKVYFLFIIVFYFMISPLAFLTTLQIPRTYGKEVWRLSTMEIVFSSGAILGGFIMASWGGFKNKVHSMAFSTVLTGIVTILLGLKFNFFIYLSIMFISGLIMPIFGTPATVLLQQKVNPDYQGRIFSISNMIHSSMMPLAMLIFGPLADIIEIEIMLLGTGVIMFILGIVMFKNKVMIEAGE